jgi:hypothetical protein
MALPALEIEHCHYVFLSLSCTLHGFGCADFKIQVIMIFQGSRFGGLLPLFLFILSFSYIMLLLMEDILYIYDKAGGVMTGVEWVVFRTL